MIWSNIRKITLRDVKEKLKDTDYELDAKRQLRESLLNAFDIYKGNVNYGTIIETAEEHNIIVSWYRDILDLKDGAFENVPEKVKKYE